MSVELRTHSENEMIKLVENINFFLSHLDGAALGVVLATAQQLAKTSESYITWWQEANHQ